MEVQRKSDARIWCPSFRQRTGVGLGELQRSEPPFFFFDTTRNVDVLPVLKDGDSNDYAEVAS